MESQEKIHEKGSKKKKNLTEKNGVVKMKTKIPSHLQKETYN